ncbi:HNH/endonuclease VII fold putative polymorphic toxin [Streptomyces sp. NPDC101206]|uniref:HNH/endonuclease VII fold putative polymorphic toxin n=1 Tax=Streptomyces sp. NPDC101206 TaxID=3366128 RepID=UPI0037FB8424
MALHLRRARPPQRQAAHGGGRRHHRGGDLWGTRPRTRSTTREEWYELPNDDIAIYQDDWFGHQKPGEPGYQPPHVHVQPGDDPRNGVIDGAEAHCYDDLD